MLQHAKIIMNLMSQSLLFFSHKIKGKETTCWKKNACLPNNYYNFM